MYALDAALKAVRWGGHSQAESRPRAGAVFARTGFGLACFLAVVRVAAADPGPAVEPDPPSPARPVVVPPARFRPTWDLDGTYLWLGPVGAASYLDTRWDSTFGGAATLVVVRERAPLGLAGASLGASRWTARGGGRMWVDGLLGTHVLGHMMGISLGTMVELSEIAHARPGASIGIWGFAGIAPFVRLGTVSDLGMFAEVGLHIALPVLRR